MCEAHVEHLHGIPKKGTVTFFPSPLFFRVIDLPDAAGQEVHCFGQTLPYPDRNSFFLQGRKICLTETVWVAAGRRVGGKGGKGRAP